MGPDFGRHRGSSAAGASLRPLRGVARSAASVFVPSGNFPTAVPWPSEARQSPHRDSQERRQQPRIPPEKVTSTNKTQLYLRGQRRWGRTLTMSPLLAYGNPEPEARQILVDVDVMMRS